MPQPETTDPVAISPLQEGDGGRSEPTSENSKERVTARSSQAPTVPSLPSLSGAALPLRVIAASHEAERGHSFRLARELNSPSEPELEPGLSDLPDGGVYLPVPDRVLDSLDELSGCAARLCLLMIRACYSWSEEMGEFRASSGWVTARQIEDEAEGLGMCRESLRSAADELEARGWIGRRKREGCATAYRWALKVPRRRFTPVPAPLFHAHQRLSHSALTVLLCVVRATLGWTTKENETLKYERTAELSTSNLEAMTGLSRPTFRSAAHELESKDALHKRRKHRGAPWEFAVDFSFFSDHLQKSYTPTTTKEKSNKHTRAEQPDSEDAHTKGRSRGRSGSNRVAEDWEKEAIELLSSDPIEMNPGRARHLVIRRSREVVENTMKQFRQRRDQIDNPAGWMQTALDQLWFGPTIANKTPDVRESSGTPTPIAQLFEDLTQKKEGWEWDEDGSTGNAKNLGGGGGRGLNVDQTAGVTHTEMCDLIDDLGRPDHDWETVERPNSNPLFVPSKQLANWAYFRRETGSEQFQTAARRVVNVRARHEGRESPIDCD